MSIEVNDVADDNGQWARRVRELSPAERARRLDAVSALLVQPDDISDILETELYILRDRLQGVTG